MAAAAAVAAVPGSGSGGHQVEDKEKDTWGSTNVAVHTYDGTKEVGIAVYVGKAKIIKGWTAPWHIRYFVVPWMWIGKEQGRGTLIRHHGDFPDMCALRAYLGNPDVRGAFAAAGFNQRDVTESKHTLLPQLTWGESGGGVDGPPPLYHIQQDPAERNPELHYGVGAVAFESRDGKTSCVVTLEWRWVTSEEAFREGFGSYFALPGDCIPVPLTQSDGTA